MKKITELTPEQEAMFSEYVRRWTAIGRCCDPADRGKAEQAIRLMYQAGGCEPPPKIVWCTSPLASALTRSIARQLQKDSIRDSVGDSVWGSVSDSVWGSIRDSVGASVWGSVGDSVGASVGDSIRGSVRDSVRASVYGQHDAGWLSFYRFFQDIGLDSETAKLKGLWMLCESAGWALPHENICWVSERTSSLHFDDAGRLHCEDGPAVSYPDGWGAHCWHGTNIPAGWVDKPPAAKDALTWQNMEQRRAACEIVGWVNILEQLDAKTIDAHKNPMVGELLEVNLPDVGQERFLRVKCGTNRLFALPVPPDMDTAENAQRWLNWVPDEIDFIPAVRT